MAKKKRARRTVISAPSAETMPFTKDGIPKTVADEMAKRLLIFGGPPTAMVFLSFPLSYWSAKSGSGLTPGNVLFISICFILLASGSAVYGMLSTPWTSSEAKSFLGWQNFKINLQRLRSALKTEGERKRETQQSEP